MLSVNTSLIHFCVYFFFLSLIICHPRSSIYLYTCNIHKIARNLFFFFLKKKKTKHFSCHDLKRIVSIIHNRKYGFKNCNCQGKALYFWILLNVISGFFFQKKTNYVSSNVCMHVRLPFSCKPRDECVKRSNKYFFKWMKQDPHCRRQSSCPE